ncbi:MAG: 4'-phosphopantetheinyl transferase [Ruegeria sp.]
MLPVEQILRTCQTRSNEFLHQLQVLETGDASVVSLIGRYETGRFHEDLFSVLGVNQPERLAKAVVKRRAEFLAGRSLAQAALTVLGKVPEPVSIGPNREPVWPKGIVGSITHSKGRCAVCLSDRIELLIGLDIEDVAGGPALDSIFHVALSSDEADLIRQQSVMPQETLATLVFSAKETLFKALFPAVGRFFGFDYAELKSAPSDTTLRLGLTKSLTPELSKGHSFDIGFSVNGGAVLTRLVLPDPRS